MKSDNKMKTYKRFHQLLDKDKKVKLDKRFSMFKNKISEDGEIIQGHRDDVKVDKRRKMFAGKPYKKVDPVRKHIEEAKLLAELTEEYISEVLGSDREWGTSTLTQQLAAETPGQSGFRVLPNSYLKIKKGSRVYFNLKSVYGVGQVSNGTPIAATLIGGDTNKARVRDDNGKLYLIDWEYITENTKVPSKAETLGVRRSEMPQIDPDSLKVLLKNLKSQNVHVDHRTVNPSTLSATQGNFDRKKIDSIISDMKKTKSAQKQSPIIVSKDNRIMDGHHRWLAHQNLGKDINICRVNKNAGELLAMLKGHELVHKNKMFEAILHMYDEQYELFESESCPLISAKYLIEFEKFIDRMFAKFKIDFDFTKHFRERISHERNDPCITIKEIAMMIQKLYQKVKENGNTIKSHKDAEAVVKDIQTDLNMPIAIEYNKQKDDFRIAAKTIMRKKNFRTPNPIIKV